MYICRSSVVLVEVKLNALFGSKIYFFSIWFDLKKPAAGALDGKVLLFCLSSSFFTYFDLPVASGAHKNSLSRQQMEKFWDTLDRSLFSKNNFYSNHSPLKNLYL